MRMHSLEVSRHPVMDTEEQEYVPFAIETCCMLVQHLLYLGKVKIVGEMRPWIK